MVYDVAGIEWHLDDPAQELDLFVPDKGYGRLLIVRAGSKDFPVEALIPCGT